LRHAKGGALQPEGRRYKCKDFRLALVVIWGYWENRRQLFTLL
jgi:hypothetical protein